MKQDERNGPGSDSALGDLPGPWSREVLLRREPLQKGEWELVGGRGFQAEGRAREVVLRLGG